MDTFRLFFEELSSIDWDSNIVTVFGSVAKEGFYERLKKYCNYDIHSLAILENEDFLKESHPISYETISAIIEEGNKLRINDEKYQQLLRKNAMNLKFIDIADPTCGTNNLGKSISKQNSSRFKLLLKDRSAFLKEIYENSTSQ